jgi:hypothetical protein
MNVADAKGMRLMIPATTKETTVCFEDGFVLKRSVFRSPV